MPVPAFTTSVFLPSQPHGLRFASTSRKSIKYAPARSTAAPERTKTSKKSLPSQYYRVLPDNLPISERPPPAPRHNSIPFVGYFVDPFLGRFDDGFHALNEKYGPIFFSNFLLAPMFFLCSYGATSDILKDNELFIARDAFPGMQGLFGDDVILFRDGKDHEVARSSLAPAFSPALFPYYL